MNHKFDAQTSLKEVKEFLEAAGYKEITRVLFLEDGVKVSFN